jgi:IS5 family transposase
MERELWSELSAAVAEVGASWLEPRRYVHPTASVVRVHLWAALHDRPISWACAPAHWLPLRPAVLPDQSTMSRRTRGVHGKGFEGFCRAVGEALERRNANLDASVGVVSRLLHLCRLDGKPLPVAAHSTDRDARWGRGAGQRNKGYKLHAITSAGRAMPERWAVAPLNVDERVVARRLVARLDGAGYVLADAMYDAADLHERCAPR